MTQQALWQDSFEDALRSLVDALGGYKRVGPELWPSMKADAAGRRLADCLNTDRDHNLELRELLLLLRKGRDKGAHIAMHYLCDELSYERAIPVNPENEIQRMQREFVESQRALVALADRIESKSQTLRRVS